MQQHEDYVAVLRQLGLLVELLEPLPEYPDAYFVEDTAVVMPELAVITYPGAAARNGEQDAIAPVLERHRPLAYILPPATLDGGDVLQVERHFYIGLSCRTNRMGFEQFSSIVAEYGYNCTAVPVKNLHLKADVSYLGDGVLLMSPNLREEKAFASFERIILKPSEAYAANALFINGHILLARGYEDGRHRLNTIGKPIIELDVSEARKMDGGLSCMSLRF